MPRLDTCAEPVRLGGDLDCLFHGGDGGGIFRTDIDEALGGAGRNAGDRHAFDEREGIAFHQHAVGKGAAVALIGIAADIFLIGLGIEDGLPLDAGRKAGAAAAAQARFGHLGDDVGWRHRQCTDKPVKSAMRAVVVDREGIDHPAAREGEAFLILEIGNLIGRAARNLLMLAAIEKIGVKK